MIVCPSSTGLEIRIRIRYRAKTWVDFSMLAVFIFCWRSLPGSSHQWCRCQFCDFVSVVDRQQYWSASGRLRRALFHPLPPFSPSASAAVSITINRNPALREGAIGWRGLRSSVSTSTTSNRRATSSPLSSRATRKDDGIMLHASLVRSYYLCL